VGFGRVRLTFNWDRAHKHTSSPASDHIVIQQKNFFASEYQSKARAEIHPASERPRNNLEDNLYDPSFLQVSNMPAPKIPDPEALIALLELLVDSPE
jgi:hypothetical protein